MKFNTLLRFSWQNITAQKLRAALTLSSVIVGGFLIFLLPSLGLGVTKSINQQLTKDQLTDISVSPKYKYREFDFTNPDPNGPDYERRLEIGDIETIKNLDGVKAIKKIGLSLSPSQLKVEKLNQELPIGSLGRSGGGSIRNVNVNVIPTGLDEKEYDRTLVSGRFLISDDASKNSIVISKSLLESLKVEKPEELIGTTLTLTFTQDNIDFADTKVLVTDKVETKQYNFTLVGITEPKVKNSFTSADVEVFIPFQTAWDITQWQQSKKKDFTSTFTLSSLDVIAKSTNDVEAVTQKIQSMNLESFGSLEMVKFFRKAATVIIVFLASFGLIALFVGSLNILNTMMMSVTERTKEIGIMRALGASRKVIRTMFLIESALIAFFGALIGMFLGWIVSLIANLGLHLWLTSIMKDRMDQIPSNVFDYSPPLILGVLAFVTLVGIISGIIPSLRASRLNVVDSLRYE